MIKKSIVILSIICIVSISFSILIGGFTVFGESNINATIYVSANGNDTNDGSEHSPLATIKAAQNKVRKMIEKGQTSDIYIRVLSGTYYIDDSIVFSPEDSGKNGYNIIYEGLGDTLPIIKGSKKITNWTKEDNNIYVADLSSLGDLKEIRVLYDNEKLVTNARYPNEGYLTQQKLPENDKDKHSLIHMPDGVPNVTDITNVRCYSWPGGPAGDWNWESYDSIISEYDVVNKTVRISNPTQGEYVFGKGSRFYLHGAKEFIDMPGEYYYDYANKKIYYYPIDKDNIDVELPIVENLLTFRGNSASKVSNIIIQNLALSQTQITPLQYNGLWSNCNTDNSGIRMLFASNIEINDCRIFNVNYTGISMEATQNCTLSGNKITDIGFSAIISSDWPAYSNYTNNTFTNNFINRTGRINTAGKGIELSFTNGNEISYNTIMNTGRHSISLGGPGMQLLMGQTIEGTLITEENIAQIAPSRDNKIIYNDCSKANQDSSDTGLIYTWGTGVNNQVVGNRLHDSAAILNHYSFGLYIDDDARNTIIKDNIIHGLYENNGELRYPLFVKASYATINNNFIVDNNQRKASFGTMEMTIGNTEYITKDIEFTHNIVSDINTRVYSHDDKGRNDRFLNFDYNLYYPLKYAENKRLLNWGNDKETAEWQSERFQNGPYDQNSIFIQDPLFMNREKQDYRLSPNSPAYSLGIKDIDTSIIGVNSDFKYSDDEPIKWLFIKVNDSYTSLFNMKEKSAQIKVIARTKSGFICDINKYDLKFTSSNPEIIQVSKEGKINAIAKGKANIKATVTKDGISNNIEVTVVSNKNYNTKTPDTHETFSFFSMFVICASLFTIKLFKQKA